MLWELENIVEMYYKWIEITENSMREMHADRRHGYSLVCSNSSIDIVKYFNGKVSTCIRLEHDLKLRIINNSLCSYVFDEHEHLHSFMLLVNKNLLLINTFNKDGQIIVSAFVNKFGRSVGTDVKWSDTGECRITKFPEMHKK